MMGRNRNAGKPGAKNPGKTFKRIMAEIMGRYKPHCVAVVLCLIVSAVANVYGTMFMQRLIDDYITPMIGRPDPDFGPMGRAVLGVALVYLLGAFSAWLYNYLMIFVSHGTLKNLRVKLFSKMERLPIKYFDTHAHGDIMSVYTNDIDTMRQMISQSMPQLISSVVTIVSIVTSMIILNVPLLIITLFMVATTMTLSVKRIKSAGRFFVAQQQDLGRVNGYIEEMMNGQKVVKVFCHEEQNFAGFKQLNDALRESAYNANRISNTIMPLTMAMGNLSYVLCAVVGGLLASGGYLGLTIGTLVSFLTLNKSFNQPINQVSQQSNAIIMALFFLCYSYQFVYLAIGLFAKPKKTEAAAPHRRIAVLIAARNEEAVIGQLLDSVRAQNYPSELLDAYVVADNCTDATAEVARQAGAVVYTRFNKEKVGKGYALERLIEHIEEDYPQTFDGFFVFDADNVLDCHFIEEMNREMLTVKGLKGDYTLYIDGERIGTWSGKQLGEGINLAELQTPPEWCGKSIRELDIRAKYGVNVIAVRENGKVHVTLDANRPLDDKLTLVLLGENDRLARVKP